MQLSYCSCPTADGVQEEQHQGRSESGWANDPHCNIGAYIGKTHRRPCNMSSAVLVAEEIMLDQMHILLDMHLDDVHTKK